MLQVLTHAEMLRALVLHLNCEIKKRVDAKLFDGRSYTISFCDGANFSEEGGNDILGLDVSVTICSTLKLFAQHSPYQGKRVDGYFNDIIDNFTVIPKELVSRGHLIAWLSLDVSNSNMTAFHVEVVFFVPYSELEETLQDLYRGFGVETKCSEKMNTRYVEIDANCDLLEGLIKPLEKFNLCTAKAEIENKMAELSGLRAAAYFQLGVHRQKIRQNQDEIVELLKKHFGIDFLCKEPEILSGKGEFKVVKKWR